MESTDLNYMCWILFFSMYYSSMPWFIRISLNLVPLNFAVEIAPKFQAVPEVF